MKTEPDYLAENDGLSKLKRLADDITLTRQNENLMFDSYLRRTEKQKRRVNAKRKYGLAATVLAILVLSLSLFLYPTPEFMVYAKAGNTLVQLKINEKVKLKKQITPLGFGYVLKIKTEGGKWYYTLEDETNTGLDNVFKDENGDFLIWMPDGIEHGKIQDEDGKEIEIPETDSSVINIRVCNDSEKEIEQVTLILERNGEECSAELLKK